MNAGAERGYPSPPVGLGHSEPCPRRVRAVVAGRTVVDTESARYVWEWPYYPQYYIPVADIAAGLLVPEQRSTVTVSGPARRHGLDLDGDYRADCAWVYPDDADGPVAGTVRLDWGAADAWFEEDEQIFVHPRSPYTRVDALRSNRHLLIELDGVRLAESFAPVLVFETGLPTRYYLDRTSVNWSVLERSQSRTGCPYKGTTSDYWNAVVAGNRYDDIAWSYAFPTRQLSPIAGLVAFFNEFVDLWVDGRLVERPETPFSRAD